MLAVENLHKSFGYLPVLQGINFTLDKGNFISLTGKNGQGKTTLLKILAHLYPADKGSIFWGRKKIQDCLMDYRRSFFFLSHHLGLYNKFSILENLKLFCSFYQEPKEEDILLNLEEVGLRLFADFPIQKTSAGMKKKALFTLIKALQPKILFLDEPYSNLDQEGVDYLNYLLNNLKNKGAIILLVSHQQVFCKNLIDQSWKLEKTKIFFE